MSKVVIQGNASGTGDFTIAAPNSNTDRTFNLPDEAGEVVVTNGTTLVVDNTNNRVGIGTTSPSARLHVANNQGGGIGRILLDANVSSGYETSLNVTDTGLEVTSKSNSRPIVFNTGSTPTEKVRITPTGTLAVNTVGSPYKIDVLDDTYVAYFHHSNGVGVFLTAGNNSWSAASDETLKENIVEINKDDSYNNIKNIRAVTYKYIVDSDDVNRLGFIAQDWEPNYPEAITLNQDNKLGLNYTETIPVLLSALQKAQEKIEALEARVTALENA